VYDPGAKLVRLEVQIHLGKGPFFASLADIADQAPAADVHVCPARAPLPGAVENRGRDVVEALPRWRPQEGAGAGRMVGSGSTAPTLFFCSLRGRDQPAMPRIAEKKS